jgi:60 kDa SS-A/Ro ribonucleoprotein
MAFKRVMKKGLQRATMPSTKPEATRNRAGGIAFEIKDPAVKLVTMTGGAFFMEPKYYNDEVPISKRKGKDGLQQRIERAKGATSMAIAASAASEMDGVTCEIIEAALNILDGDNPKDVLSIAHWLRREMNIRTTPQVLLVLASRHPASQPYVRAYVPKIVARPDEVKVVIQLHRWFFGLKTMTNCIRNGLSDAMSKMGEKALIKYEGTGWPSWKDAIFMVTHRKGYPFSKELSEYLMFDKTDAEKTPIAHARKALGQCKSFCKKAQKLAIDSGVNWEVLLSQFGSNAADKKALWSFLVEEDLLGYMALMRNLRNIATADVEEDIMRKAAAKLSDPKEVANSKQLPFRYVAALNATREGVVDARKLSIINNALEEATEISAANIPEIPGTTVVFADNSGSMGSHVSEKSKITCAAAANILAGIMAKRSTDARICAFATDVGEVSWTKRTRVLEFVDKVTHTNTNGCSTDTYKCANWLVKNKLTPDRVIILSDMQCWDSGTGRSSIYGNSERSFCDAWAKFKKGSQRTWLHCVNLAGSGDSMNDSKADRVNLVSGFSERIVKMLLEAEGVADGVEAPVATIEQIREKW